jgi:hypothetical protein
MDHTVHVQHLDGARRSEVPVTNGSTKNLPLVVWLRGDEPYFTEFSLDAEAVMQQLGIKRSRLTQISGNELRVGRTRIDRYVRPVYRPCDIDEYQQWTRATASHHKSSTLLEQAAHKLEDSSRDFAFQLAQLGENLRVQQGEQLQRQGASLLAALRLLLQQCLEISRSAHDSLLHQQQRASMQVQRGQEEIIDQLQKLASGMNSLAGLTPLLEEIMASTRYLQQSVLQLQVQHEAVHQQGAHMQGQLQHLAAQQEEYFSPAAPRLIRRPSAPRPRGSTRATAAPLRAPRVLIKRPRALRPKKGR